MTNRWTPWTLCLGLLAAAGCDSTASTADSGADVVTPNDVVTADAPAPTDTPVPTDNAQPIDAPVPTDTPVPTDNALPTDNAQPTDTPVPTDVPTATARTTPTNGSAVVLSADGTFAVAVNRTANSVSVFRLSLGTTPPTAMTPTTIAIPDSEPWQVVLSNDENTAYVALRRSGQLAVINNLRTTPTLGMRVAVGSEPTGVAISPLGQRVFVANWSDGTVTALNTSDLMVAARIDLNPALAASGMLGTVTARPALAHPRALVVTNNGNGLDTDETLYVTEFFSQARTDSLPVADATFDVGRQGVIYRVSLGDNAVGAPITLAPTANTGFNDSAGNVTGCFPNQLNAIAVANGRAYVTGVCTSPRGPTGPVTRMDNSVDPSNFKTQIHGAVWAVDTAMNREVVGEGLLLTRAFQARYDANMVPDNATRRIPLLPNDIAFVPGSRIAYLTAYGSDAAFRLDLTNATAPAVGSGTSLHFIDLAPMGRLPVGIAVRDNMRALVINESTRNLTLVDLGLQAAASVTASAPTPTGDELERNTGRRLFVTGLGRWSLRGQAWNSCESCHPDGQTDNVTWFFARGPRQTTSLDGSYGPTGAQRVFNWTAIFDEVHDFELNTRGNSGGVGAVVHRNNDGATPPVVGNPDRIIFDGTAAVAPQVATATNQAGLNGAVRSMMPGTAGSNAVRSTLRDWEEIEAWMRTVRAPNAPSNLNPADVNAGRALFIANNCAGCHGTSSWTVSRRFWTPSEATNGVMGTLRTTRYVLPAGFPAALNPPANNVPRDAALRFDIPAMAGAQDQINCVLRNVGTFPAMLATGQPGIAPAGVQVREVRADMATAAQGATGFNPPALVGMMVGAPYLHAGNARTLEETFSNTFAAHHQAFAANFLVDGAGRAEQLRQIVAFVLSIDDSTTAVDVPRLPVAGMAGMTFNPDVCPTALP